MLGLTAVGIAAANAANAELIAGAPRRAAAFANAAGTGLSAQTHVSATAAIVFVVREVDGGLKDAASYLVTWLLGGATTRKTRLSGCARAVVDRVDAGPGRGVAGIVGAGEAVVAALRRDAQITVASPVAESG